MALLEDTTYDPCNGRAVVRNLADYHVLSCTDTPDITMKWLGIPDPHIRAEGKRLRRDWVRRHGGGHHQCRVVYHATGQRLRKLPLTPDKLFAAG